MSEPILPVPREPDKSTGWTTSTKLLDALADELNCNDEYNLSWEQVDDLIRELAKRGYLAFEPL